MTHIDMNSNPWQELSAAPRDGSFIEVLYDDDTTERGVYWAPERYCMIGAPQGSKGPGFMSSECNLPVEPIKWRFQVKD